MTGSITFFGGNCSAKTTEWSILGNCSAWGIGPDPYMFSDVTHIRPGSVETPRWVSWGSRKVANSYFLTVYKQNSTYQRVPIFKLALSGSTYNLYEVEVGDAADIRIFKEDPIAMGELIDGSEVIKNVTSCDKSLWKVVVKTKEVMKDFRVYVRLEDTRSISS